MITGPRETVRRARTLRSEMSLPETIMWRELRKRPGGFKFRRQHPAGRYVLDFYCAATKLAIEIDGWAHDSARAVAADKERSRYLRTQGIATTRIPATRVLQELPATVTRLVEICRSRESELLSKPNLPLHQPAAGPPPLAGEDI